MLKDINHITIRDYSLFEKTGNTKYLCWYYCPVAKFYKAKMAALIAEITAGMGSESGQDAALSKEYHRIKSVYRIEYLITLYQAAYNLLINKTQIDIWKGLIGKNKGSNYTNLIEYIDKIKEATGILIGPENWDDDMMALKAQIDRWTDKYNETFTMTAAVEGATFMQLVLGVFAALQFPINEQICLSDFFEMKRQAEKLSKRIQLERDGRQH